MKKIWLLFISLTFSSVLTAQQWKDNLPKGQLQNGTLTFYEIQKAFNDYWDPLNVKNGYYKNEKGEQVKAVGWKQFKRWEWYWENRIVKETGQFPKTSASEELERYLLENPEGRSAGGNWISLGPTTTAGGYAGLGRMNCVGFVSGDNNTIYVGSASGGIWKTSNGGTSWTPIGDYNAVLGVSDIVAYRPASLPDVIYIATGDRDGGSMWSLGGGQYNDNNSVGVLKSTDGGTTWNTTGLSFTASQQRTVNRLLISPSDNNILYAATSVGVYKTINGGTSWSPISANVFIDMEFMPGTPSTIYGSTFTGDIYRSLNDGSTWTQTLSTSYSRTELAVSPNNSAIVYAVLANSSSGLAGIYKSTDNGASFTQVFSGATSNMLNWDCNSTTAGGQGSYDLCIAADPANANNVFVGGINTWKSTNGGSAWAITNHWTSSYGCGVSEVHADQHCLAYQNGTSTLFEGNDGGVYKTTNNGSTWIHIGSGLATSQIYRLGVAQTVANEDITGLQDNGTKAFLSGAWSDELGGDGFDCAIDYTNQNTLYGELYYGDIRRSTNHGSSWTSISTGLTGSSQWCTPFVIDPIVNTTVYIGYQDVWKSTNQGTAWTKISSWAGSVLQSLAVAPSNSSYIYTATSTALYRTTNGGTSWSNITGTIPVGSGDITYICIKNDDPNTAWVSLGGYNTTRVYQTINGGTSWTNISTGLPSLPVMCLVQNKQNTSQVELYAGTDVGVYMKAGSANWTMFSTGLPNVVVTELEIYYNTTPANSRIRAATYGRGLWQSDLCTSSPASVTIAASANPVCAGTSVTFTPTPVNGGTPTYQWYKNSVAVGTGTTYSYVPVNGDQVYVIMTSSLSCVSGNPATSNTVIMTVNPVLPVSVSISPSSNPVCDGTSVTFTPIPVNGGTPSYQWYKNTVAVGTGSTYSYIPVNGDQVYVIMTSSLTCKSGSPATSNTVTMNVNPVLPVSISISSSANPVCDGTSVTFTPIPVNGGPPSYQWYKNTIAVGTGSTYSYIPVNGDHVYVIMTSSLTCKSGSPATSDIVTMNVYTLLTANFTADKLTPQKYETVIFTDLTTGGATAWSWSFDRPGVVFVNGTNASSQNPQVQFTDGGLYQVTLLATHLPCSDSEIKSGYLRAGISGLWTGNTSSDWNTLSNWDNYLVPDGITDVVIPPSAPFWPVFTGDFILGTHGRNLILNGTTSKITITGNLVVQ